MDSEVQSTSEIGLSRGKNEPRSKQGVVQTKSRIGKYIAYLPVLLGAIFIYWFLQPGNATPGLDHNIRESTLVAYAIGAAIVAAFVRLRANIDNDIITSISMLIGGIGCGAVVLFVFFMAIVSVS